MSTHTRFARIVTATIATVTAVVCVVLSMPTPAGAQGSSNPPWFPSLMAFEHYDSGRTKLFEHAHFTGSFARPNAVDVRISPDEYPTPYNVVYRSGASLFIFGGAYGDRGGTGSFVGRVDPQTLQTVWVNQLIDTVATNEWNYPGMLSAVKDGFLSLIYGYRLAKLDPRDGQVVEAPEFIGGRITATEFENRFYVYLTGQTSVFRYIYENQHLILDTSWDPGMIVLPGQSGLNAAAVMNDWVIFETNAVPAATPMNVVAINQADAARQFRIHQPFAAVPAPQSWSLSAVTVDPLRNRIFAQDGLAGQIAALELRNDGLHTVWTAPQRTIEFLALIGPAQRRVLVGTDVPAGQQIPGNTNDWVVWRNADTGDEIVRSPLLSAVNGGTMIEPGYSGRMYFVAQNGKIIELTVSPAAAK